VKSTKVESTMLLPAEPLKRFTEIYNALNAERGWFADATPLRFAAIAAIVIPGNAREVAADIRAVADELAERAGWFGELNGSIRFIVAAMLVANEDSAADFMAEKDRIRSLFREAKMSRGGTYEMITALIMRGADKYRPEAKDVQRLQAIHKAMSQHQWWLTSVDDYPACAILSGREQSPKEISQYAEDIYQAIHAVGFSRGNALQSAANLLCLTDDSPKVIANRFAELAEAFRLRGTRVWQNEYDEIAILAFLAEPSSEIVTQVLDNQRRIRELSPRPSRSLAFNLSSSIAFAQLVHARASCEPISDAKALMDMQAIIAAQHAAIIAATVASTSAATAASN
jgi:hypothetical protein